MEVNYRMLILDGWVNNNEFLDNYFYREITSAESNNMPANEFVSYLRREIKGINEERLKPYYTQLNLWNRYYIQEIEKGNEVNIPMPDNADGYLTPLIHLTNGKYLGHIGKSDLDYIDQSIDLALDRLTNEKALPPQQTETKTEQEQPTENNFTLSTIEDWLFEFKEKMSENDYQILVSALIKYFDTGTFPKILKPIQINGRPNKKLFGWALNRIFEAKGKGVEKELLLFAKQNISLFTGVEFDENNISKSNLYKYFTTKTE